jgi:fructoselysine 6-kinase
MPVLCVDKYPELGLELPGGNSLNIAARWKALGVKEIGLMGAVGTDSLGDLVLEKLRSLGIDAGRVARLPGQTAYNHFFASGDSHLFREEGWIGGAYDSYRPTEDDWAFAAGFDLISIHYLDPRFKECLARFGAKGRGKPRLAIDFLDKGDTRAVMDALPFADLAFMSGTRAMADELAPAARDSGVPLVVTLGAEGSLALIGGERFFQPALPAEKAVDSIGCGDSFQAAFIVAWYENKDPRAALRAGSLAAAEILARHGAC